MVKREWQPTKVPVSPVATPRTAAPVAPSQSQTLPRAKRGRISVHVDATKPEHIDVREIPSKRRDPRSE